MPNASDSELYDPIDGRPCMDNPPCKFFRLGYINESQDPNYFDLNQLDILIEKLEEFKDTHRLYVTINRARLLDAQLDLIVSKLKVYDPINIRSDINKDTGVIFH